MSKNSTLRIASAFFIVLFGVISFSTALAVKPVGASKVMGVYHFVATFTRFNESVLDHCSTFGTLEFDGKRFVYLSGTERCDDNDSEVTEYGPEEYEYELTNDHVVKIYEPDPATWTQCQALDNGQTLLCHGIYRDVDHLNFMAVGKRAD
jgi:hypothetical protein